VISPAADIALGVSGVGGGLKLDELNAVLDEKVSRINPEKPDATQRHSMPCPNLPKALPQNERPFLNLEHAFGIVNRGDAQARWRGVG
jgi:hypothetical protein